MKERLTSQQDVKLVRTLMETLIDIREAFEEINQLFKIDINLEELEAFQPKKLEFSEEWAASLIKICEVLIALYDKIDKKELAEKWQKKLEELKNMS